MSTFTLVLIALGVSADAFAVAVGKGLQLRTFRQGQAWRIALTFGVFQALMPLMGYLLGSRLEQYVAQVDHWLAFGLLLLVGGRMVWEALEPGAVEPRQGDPDLGVRELAVLGVATSIDALAVGISFAVLDVDVPLAMVVIGLTTVVLTYVGVLLGHRAGARWRLPAEIAGGVLLMAVGTRILIEHLSLG